MRSSRPAGPARGAGLVVIALVASACAARTPGLLAVPSPISAHTREVKTLQQDIAQLVASPALARGLVAMHVESLDRGGLTIRDVQPINLGNAYMPAGFANGSIDAAVLGSPYAEQIEADGTGVTLATDLVPGLMTVAFVGSGQFLEERLRGGHIGPGRPTV